MNLKEIRQKFEQKQGQRHQIKLDLTAQENMLVYVEKEIKHSQKAKIIIQQVARETQEQLEYHISDMVSMNLETIFDEDYNFGIEFVVKNNRTVCELFYKVNGEKINPLDEDAGGGVDVTSFALRIALWTLQNPRSINTIILDEPFKFLSKDLLPRGCELLTELSKKLNMQFIIITHLTELEDTADRVFKFKMRKGETKIEVL